MLSFKRNSSSEFIQWMASSKCHCCCTWKNNWIIIPKIIKKLGLAKLSNHIDHIMTVSLPEFPWFTVDLLTNQLQKHWILQSTHMKQLSKLCVGNITVSPSLGRFCWPKMHHLVINLSHNAIPAPLGMSKSPCPRNYYFLCESPSPLYLYNFWKSLETLLSV